MHYRFTEGTAAIRGTNDAFSLVRDAFPVAISRTIPNGFGPRSVAQGKRWLNHAGPGYTYRHGSHIQGSARQETNVGAARARAPARCHSEPYAAGDVSADTHSGGVRRAGSERMVSGANPAAGRGPRAPCYEYGLDATPCYSGWCTVRMMSAGVAKVPVVTCTPRLFMLAQRQSSTAS